MNRNLRDLHTPLAIAVALASTAVSADGTSAGNIIDRQGSDAVEFITHLLARTDGTYTPLIEHGDASNLSDAVAVDDADLLGTEAGAALTAVGLSKIGYIGNKRYVRLSIVASGVTTGGTIAAVVLESALSQEGGV